MSDIKVLPPGDGGAQKLHKKLYKTDRTALVFASGTTVKSFTIQAYALTHTIVVEIPSFSGAIVTAVLSIENCDTKEIYASNSLVENSVNVIATEKPLYAESTVKITLSTDPKSEGICYVTIYMTGGE